MKKIKKIITIIVFFIGISLLLYPHVGNIISSYRHKKSINEYVENINAINEIKNEKMYEEAIKYNEKIYTYQQTKKKYNFKDEYQNVLKINDTMIMGYIEIPKVSIRLPIYHGVESNVLEKGVGHVMQSSLPIGTINQNSVLMGHSGLPISKIFTNLEKLVLDDYIKIVILNRDTYYKVNKIEVVMPDEVIDKIKVEEGKTYITLVTCTPYGVNSHRLIIRAEKTDDVPDFGKVIETKSNRKIDEKLILLICIAFFTTILCLIIYLAYKKKNNKVKIIDKEITNSKNNLKKIDKDKVSNLNKNDNIKGNKKKKVSKKYINNKKKKKHMKSVKRK